MAASMHARHSRAQAVGPDRHWARDLHARALLSRCGDCWLSMRLRALAAEGYIENATQRTRKANGICNAHPGSSSQQRLTAVVSDNRAWQIIDGGVRSTVVCVDSNRLDRSFCGRELDHRLVEDLPPDADPCGERGEYHTFVHHAPAFRRPIAFSKAECVWRKPFWFCDLAPAGIPALLARTG